MNGKDKFEEKNISFEKTFEIITIGHLTLKYLTLKYLTSVQKVADLMSTLYPACISPPR